MSAAEAMIARHGDQAYWRAIEYTVVAAQLGDDEAARSFAGAAQELVRRGYHKKRQRVLEEESADASR